VPRALHLERGLRPARNRQLSGPTRSAATTLRLAVAIGFPGLYEVANQGVSSPRPGHEPLSEQQLAISGGNTRAPARLPGRRTGLERGLDSGGDELRGLRVDDDVPAEQNAADDLPGVWRRVARADGSGEGTGGIGLGHTRDCRRKGLVRLLDTPDLQRLLRRSLGGGRPGPVLTGDHVANRSIYNTRGTAGDQSGLLTAPPASGMPTAARGSAVARQGTTEGAGAPQRG
jgi:hypothetical protein